MALLDLGRDQGCLPILWVISGTCGSRHMKGVTWRVDTAPRKTKSTSLFLILNNSFNMKLGGSPSGGFPQGDTGAGAKDGAEASKIINNHS